MTILGSGNVGVGTTTPAYKLDVNGDTNIASGSALRFAGTSVCTSAGCTSTSDVRLKENIKPLEQSLEKVLKLRGVEYNYKDKKKYGEGHQVGVIAQEVEKVYPEVVKTDAKTGFKAVAYDHLVAPIIEAIKKLYYRLTGVERDVANLKSENDSLKKRSDKLEKENSVIKSENVAIKKALCELGKTQFCR